jgi:hypothetical protein
MNEDAHKKSLTIEMDREAVAACFIQLLTEGVTIEASLDCNLKYLLCDQIGMAPDYLEKRLQTVFLDGQPVDDVEQTIVGEGSVIALSAAMPGLVGAVLRKGGTFAGLRKSITYRCDRSDGKGCVGRVTIKLFNMTTREVGPLLLKYGILIDGEDVLRIVSDQAGPRHQAFRQIRLANRSMSMASLPESIRPEDTIFLQVSIV